MHFKQFSQLFRHRYWQTLCVFWTRHTCNINRFSATIFFSMIINFSICLSLFIFRFACFKQQRDIYSSENLKPVSQFCQEDISVIVLLTRLHHNRQNKLFAFPHLYQAIYMHIVNDKLKCHFLHVNKLSAILFCRDSYKTIL